jgi:predicted outer membrane protein
MNSRWKSLVAFSAALLLVGVVVAQDPAQRLRDQPQQPARPGAAAAQPGQPGAAGGGSLDSHLAQCLTMDNQHEIALAEVAKQRSQDNEVRQFADRLIQDHTQFLQQLARFAGNQPGIAGGQPGEGRPNERTGQPGQPATGQPGQPGGAMAQAQGGQPNFLALKQQIGQKALDMTKKELEKKEGVEFDKCFIATQIGNHIWALSTLEVFKDQQISPDLRNVIEKGIQTTQEHLDHAKKLADNLQRQGGRETAGRPSELRSQ